MTKPEQVFRPYQLHRDQLSIVRKYDLVCVGSPPANHVELAPSGFEKAFCLDTERNRFMNTDGRGYVGDTADYIYFCSRSEAKQRGLKWKPVPLAYPRKVDFAAQIAALEEENKTLREKLAKIAALAGETK